MRKGETGRKTAAVLLAVSMLISNMSVGMPVIAGETEVYTETDEAVQEQDAAAEDAAAQQAGQEQEAAGEKPAAETAEQTPDAAEQAAAQKAQKEAEAAEAAAKAAKEQAAEAQSEADAETAKQESEEENTARESREEAGTDTAEETEMGYPPFVVKDLPVEGTDITVSVEAPEGAFPEGIRMRAVLKETPVQVLEAANAEIAYEAGQENAAEDGAEVTPEDAVTFNIGFYLDNDPETEIEPLVPISVTFGNLSFEGDTLEVWHSDDSQEGEVQVEKVLDGAENAHVLTVNGLDRFSDYTVLVKNTLLGAAGDPFELEVTVTPDGGSALTLTEEGVDYTSDNRSKKYTIHFEAKYPTAANKELEIQLPYGLAWATGYQTGWSFNGHESETWYKEVEAYTTPDQQTDPDKQGHSLNGRGMRDGALTIHWKDGLESVEFEFVIVTTEVYDLAQTGLGSIEDAIRVSLSYDDEVKKTVRMNLEQPKLELTPDKLRYGTVDVDEQDRIKVLEDGSTTNSVYFGAVPKTTGGHMYKDDYELWFEMPAGVIWEKTLNSNNQPYTLLGTPTLHQAGEVLTLSDGTQYTIPEGKQVYTFAASDAARIQAPAAGNRAFGPIWNFPKEDFPAGTEVTIRMLDVQMKYWMNGEFEQFDRSKLPAETYIIVAPEEEIYINTGKTGARSANRDGSTLSFGVPDFQYTQEAQAGVFRIGNRKISDSRPKLMTYRYDVNNTGAGGITEQFLYGITNDPVYGTTTLSNVKVKLWKPGDPASETEWITVPVPSDANRSIRMTDVPGWTEGYYLRAIQCEVDRIPALSQTDDNSFYGVELTDTPLTAKTFLTNLTIEDLPDSGYTDTVTGGEYTFFTGKTIIPVYYPDNGNGMRTINAGETKELWFRLNGGNRTNYIDEIYMISPYGDPYTNIQAVVPINGRSLSGYTAVEPVVTEIDAAYGDGSFRPSQEFTDKYPNARVYKLDFTGITEIHEMYLSRQYGQTDATAKARAEDDMSIANNISSLLRINFTMEANAKDPSGTTDLDLVWVKVWRPDDLTNVTFENISALPFVPDVYNLTGDTSTLLHKGISLTFINEEEVQVIPAVKKTTDPDDQYQTYDGTEGTVVRSNQTFDYRLEIFNSSTKDAKGLQIYVPVPKKTEYWGSEFQPEGPFLYDMFLTGAINLPDGYEAAYAKGVTPGNQHDTWDTYDWTTDTSAWTKADWDAVNFIRIINTAGTVIAPGTDVYAYYQLQTTPDIDEENLKDNVENIWRPYYLRELSGVSAFRRGKLTATAPAPARISGVVFDDLKNDGSFDPDDGTLPDTGIANVTVEAWRDVPGRRALTKIAETTTDADGRYLFDKLIEGEEYTIIVKNPDTDTYFSFSVYGPAAERFEPVEDQSQASTKTPITAQLAAAGAHMAADSGLLEPISIPVTKIWNDRDDQDGFRPDRISVTLKGAAGDREYVLTADDADADDETGNTWSHTFENLTAYENGVKINYSVAEATNAVITGTNGPGTYAFYITGNADNGFVITNTHTPENLEITVSKRWEDDNNAAGLRPDEITVHLFSGEDETDEVDEAVISEDEQTKEWSYTFTGLPKYSEGTEIPYRITEEEVENYTTDIRGFEIVNTALPSYVNMTVTKVWDDNENQDGIRPGVAVVQLMADDEPYDGSFISLDASNGWTKTIPNLPEYSNGSKIKYSFAESKVEGYETEISDPALVSEDEETRTTTYSVTVTNTHTPAVIPVPVQKVWDDKNDQDGVRPDSVTLRLLVNGHAVKKAGEDDAGDEDEDDSSLDADWDDAYKVTLTEADAQDDNKNVWAYVFENMPKYDHGQEITYSVTEDVPENYALDIEGNAVINTFTPGKTSVTVTKAWDDNYNQDGKRPTEVKVDLLKDGEIDETVTLTEGNGWTYTWQGLDAKKNDGKGSREIVYGVREHDVEIGGEYGDTGYTLTSIEETAAGSGSWIITNTYVPETVTVSGTKTWDDADDQDGVRPKNITVRLLADGIFIASQEVTADDGWTYTFNKDSDGNDLPAYDNGKKIAYTVTEDAVTGYTMQISGYNITNTYTPDKTFVTVIKTWKDDKDAAGKRPESIIVRLYADGTEVGRTTLSEDDGWFAIFKGLDARKDGKEIKYTVTEDKVTDYTSSISGDAQKGYTITNTYTGKAPEKKKDEEESNKTDTSKTNVSSKSSAASSGTPGASAVKTGDNTPVMAYLVLTLAALAVMALAGWMLIRRRRQTGH